MSSCRTLWEFKLQLPFYGIPQNVFSVLWGFPKVAVLWRWRVRYIYPMASSNVFNAIQVHGCSYMHACTGLSWTLIVINLEGRGLTADS